MIGIYIVKNKLNGKVYVGQSVEIEIRWKHEINESLRLKYPKNKFIRALKKYGAENFEFSILEECKIEELDEKEIFYIKKYNSTVFGYNTSLGGKTNRKVDYNLFFETVKNNPNISNSELAKKFGIVPDTALRIRSRLNLPRRKFKREILLSKINAKKDEIIYLYNQGISIKSIANKLLLDGSLLLEIINNNWKLEKRQQIYGSNVKKIIVYDKNGNFLKISNTKDFFKEVHGCRFDSLKNKRRTDKNFIFRYYKENFPKKLAISKKINLPWYEWWKEGE